MLDMTSREAAFLAFAFDLEELYTNALRRIVVSTFQAHDLASEALLEGVGLRAEFMQELREATGA